MFDISFSELLVIAVVALVVIGPEKLPKVARTAGAFFGRMQRFVAQVKDEVNRESRFQELQHLQDEVKSSLQHGLDTVSNSIAAPGLLDAPTPVAEESPTPRKPRASTRSRKQPAKSVAAEADVNTTPARARKSTASKQPARIQSGELFDVPPAEQMATAPATTPKPRVRKKASTPPVDEA